MRAIYLSLVLAACNWAVVNIERTSSGAVERDVDFQPLPGTDGHYISLPAHPLVNCADTLIYDKLLTDFLSAAAHADALLDPADFRAASRAMNGTRGEHEPDQAAVGQRRDEALFKFLETLTSTTLAKVARVSHDKSITSALVQLARQGSDLAKLRPVAPRKSTGDTLVCLTTTHDHLIDRELMEHESFSERQAAAERERLKEVLAAAMRGATAIAAAASPELNRRVPLIAKLARLKRAPPGCSPLDGDVIDALVGFAKGISDDLDKLRKVAPRDVFSDQELERMYAEPDKRYLDDAILSFVKLADGFGPSPCASGARYRNFLGYIRSDAGHNPSWIDRDEGEQLKQLQSLEHDVGLASDDELPTAAFAFLHFSDLQIREPSAKLGGSDVSATLRNIQASFEQDYDQQQYSMFVYEAIVATANAEWCLYQSHDARCGSAASSMMPPDPRVRPAPVMMVHTGDAVDMGLQSEFDAFLASSDKLRVPWYQALGNHDVLAFGNLKLSSRNAPRSASDECQGWGSTPCTCTNLNTLVRAEVARTPDNQGMTPDDMSKAWFTQLPNLVQRVCVLHQIASDWFVMDPDKQRGGNPTSSFVMSHCAGWYPRPGDTPSHVEPCKRASEQVSVASEYAHKGRGVAMDRCAVRAQDPIQDPTGEQTSRMHGFDLEPGFEPAQTPSQDLGYYCFQVAPNRVANGGRVWGVVLNTNTDAGAFGVLPPKQLQWLRGLLPSRTTCTHPDETDEQEKEHGALIRCKDLVLLFAHHPIWSLYDQRDRLALTELVTTRPNIVGMFVGHKHRSDLRMIRPLAGSDGEAKWEVMAASVSEWPQAASEVTLKTHGHVGYFEVLTFTPHGTGESEPKIRAAEAGAIRDKCRNEPDKCPDGDNRIRLPNRDLTFPRLFFRLPGN